MAVNGILGIKLGMAQVFADDGSAVGCTVLQAGPCVVVQRRTKEKDGYEAEWRGIYDDKGRVMVAICHNMDLGDAWEWSDDPRYPEKWASLAYRIAVNYTIYDMTH